MATITIRNLPDQTIEAIKEAAAGNGRSMEEELRSFLRSNYLNRPEMIRAVENSWREQARPTKPEEIEAWKRMGRP